MTITASDLKFFASEYMSDADYGGGRMSSYAVQTGVENNAFPDIPPTFRATGGVQLRKIYAACVSANDEAVSFAQAVLSAGPADAAVDVVLFAYGDQTTRRSAAQAAIQTMPYAIDGVLMPYADVSGEPLKKGFETFNPALGTLVGFVDTALAGSSTLADVAVVTAVTAASPGYVVTFSKAPPAISAGPANTRFIGLAKAGAKTCGIATTTATSGASSVSVNRVEARLVPDITPYPSIASGIIPSGLALTGGKVPIFRSGDTVVISGGGNAEAAVVSFVDYRGALTFGAALAHSYPSGSKVASAADFGTLQAVAGPSFAQQTWTRAWSDIVVGNTITASYNRVAAPVAVTNLGAITERWAVIFTSPTAFRLVGESIGQIASGTTTADFSPINPATSAPYFTLPAAGWGSGWSTGNVLRLNTFGAYAPLWMARCVSPSAPGGVDGSTAQIRGSVNA